MKKQISIIKKIISYAAACTHNGNPKLNIKHFDYLPAYKREKAFADHQVNEIAEALQDGWMPDYTPNNSQEKWYCLFIWRGSGFVFSASGYDYDGDYAYVGSALVFDTVQKADYFGKKFIKLHNQRLKKPIKKPKK